MQKYVVGLLLAIGLVCWSSSAHAHISIPSGPGFADKNQEITFAVGHGCEGADTVAVRIELPPAIVSARAEYSGFGIATVETDAAGLVTAVQWQKPAEDFLSTDSHYYTFTIRMKVPNAPFTTLHFPVHQTCASADGTMTTVDWVGTDPDDPEIEPAPVLTILPPRMPGWNAYTVPANIEDLSAFFGDALIVWRDTAAWSANPNTVEMIANTQGVTALESLSAGDSVWVRY